MLSVRRIISDNYFIFSADILFDNPLLRKHIATLVMSQLRVESLSLRSCSMPRYAAANNFDKGE